MNIIINNTKTEIPKNTSVVQLLELQGIKNTTGKAIAVNEVVIQKKEWNKYILNENDKVLIIKAVSGG